MRSSFPTGQVVQREMQKKGLEDKKERQILIFTLASEELGVDISCVREVLRPQKTYPLPQTPLFIEGVIHLRGYIIALIDLRKKLIGKPMEEDLNKRIIVCRVNKSIVGLTVNSLREIITLTKDDIMPTPEVVATQMETKVISGIARVGERIIPILDLESILTKNEVAELSALKQ
ncbi:MAG TPA: chemotaxis protein CheW [Thermodesulfobacteriota bacterium]|nr:chemotaxis protein CheW [Thermodesulfobacteriota bacterium]